MSGSGHKKVVWNSRERVLSDDLNRAQSFMAAWHAELVRHLFDGDRDSGLGLRDDEDGGAPFTGLHIDTEAPLRAVVFGGLTVIPQVGKASLHILPGMLGCVNPDSAPSSNDSPYKVVYDPDGVDTDGVLVIADNTSGSIRIDVIECRRITLVTESDNRDQYNPATGLFSPVLVDKVEVDRLEFRVRQGAPAGGYPGHASGWLPLAIASVPNGTIGTTNGVTFWDVRPVAADLALNHGTGFETLPQGEMRDLVSVNISSEQRCSGFYKSTVGQWRIGGRLRSPTQNYLRLDDASIHEPGFSVIQGDLWYLWLLFPEGLPRWVRYSESVSEPFREPRGPRGIAVVSTKAPGFTKMPVLVFPPSSTGLTNSANVGRCAIAAFATGVGVLGNQHCDGDWLTQSGFSNELASTTPSDVNEDRYTLVAGTHFPSNAKALRVQVGFTLSGSIGDEFSYAVQAEVRTAAAGDIIAIASQGGMLRRVTRRRQLSAETIQVELELPRPASWTMGPIGGTFTSLFLRINWSMLGTMGSKSATSLRVLSWKL